MRILVVAILVAAILIMIGTIGASLTWPPSKKTYPAQWDKSDDLNRRPQP